MADVPTIYTLADADLDAVAAGRHGGGGGGGGAVTIVEIVEVTIGEVIANAGGVANINVGVAGIGSNTFNTGSSHSNNGAHHRR